MKPTLENLANMPEVFQYGSTAGYAPLLEFLNGYFKLPETHAAMITTGSQQGLDLIARAYVNPGDKVVMEAPSYLGAMQVFGLVRADIVTVSQTEFGPNLEELEQCFAEQKPKMFYAVPDFHNPTGVCWALETRQKFQSFVFNTTSLLLKTRLTVSCVSLVKHCRLSPISVLSILSYCVRSLRSLLRVFALVW